MESVAAWQVASLFGLFSWIVISSMLNVTQKLRSLIKPWVIYHVTTGTPFILQIQKWQHKFLDGFFSALSCVVSVPFYTGFLPLLFWSGHGKLARQMTLLMAFCDYAGNCVKDVISAPRPSCPPVRRVTATNDEVENAQEYGLPSSHTLNTVCLSGYLLCYVITYSESEDSLVTIAGLSIVCVFIGLIALGRMYLGMHSLIDIIGGLVGGLIILAVWLKIHDSLDNFIVSGQNEQTINIENNIYIYIYIYMYALYVVNDTFFWSFAVTSFWAALSFLLLFAYPTPELPTPSFEFHTAFDGVALGIVTGVQQTYQHFHHESVPYIFTPELTSLTFVSRVLVGIPTILIVKFCSKSLAKWILPITLNAMGIPIRSTTYIPGLNGALATDAKNGIKQSGFVQKMLFFSDQNSFDVDTGIRFLQYAGLAWSVVDLVPSLFSQLNL
ncbi:hypothetical protein V2J09_015907 [Rumex salicifolius]